MRGLKLSEALGYGFSCNDNIVAYLAGSSGPLNAYGLNRKKLSKTPIQARPGPSITSSYSSSLGFTIQRCQTPIHPISPSSLLDLICWSISEPTSSACIYTDSFSSEDASDHQSVFFEANGDGKDSGSGASFTNLTRSLRESEKNELVFKNQFLTILFPVDRFSETGPSSRTYFSHNGFTCLGVWVTALQWVRMGGRRRKKGMGI